MSRRPVNPGRRFPDSASVPLAGSLHHKTRTSPVLSVGLVIVGALLLIGYSYSGSGLWYLAYRLSAMEIMLVLAYTAMHPNSRKSVGIGITSGFGSDKEIIKNEGASCTSEALRAIPFLQKAYGDSMHKVLHVGPETCSVVSKLLKEEDTEAWGVEPYDLEDADSTCKSLIRKGIVRVADIKFPLPYRPRSFSLVIVSDALDYLSPRYLNKTLPEMARVSTDGVVVFAGYPGQQRLKVPDLSKFGKPAKLRSSSWWIRYFVQMGLEENEAATKKFEQAASKKLYKPTCQVFHLNS